jgi:hypothetical protein
MAKIYPRVLVREAPNNGFLTQPSSKVSSFKTSFSSGWAARVISINVRAVIGGTLL